MEKDNNSNESDFSEKEIPNLNVLKPFEFVPKTNRDINSSSSDCDNEYSSEVFQTVLAVPHFSNDAQKSQKQLFRGVL